MIKLNFFLLIFAVCLILCCSETIEKDQKPVVDLPTALQMPMHVGRGYHILLGNPKDEKEFDKGFRNPIFEYTYTKKKTTEDGKWIIPDQVVERRISTCSFTTTVNQFRGTKSYQDELKLAAKVGGGSKLYGFEFSVSPSFERIHNITTQLKDSMIHATAQCQAYEVIIEKYALPKLTDAFVRSAIAASATNHWDIFIEQYGTHYSDENIMGGRAVQQTIYSYSSVSKMESLEIDINVVAKASFAKFFVDTSFDFKKYQKDIQYSQRSQSSKILFYLGGQPARDGNIHEWQTKIVDNPMPISYRLSPLYELFEHITDTKFNKTLAIQQFQTAMGNECTKYKCRAATDDFPKPPPAHNMIQKTAQYGEANAQEFYDLVNSTTMELRRVNIRSGVFIDNLQLLIGDGVNVKYTQAVGGNGGNLSEWTVPQGEHVSQIEFRTGSIVDSLTFITNKGYKSPKYGGDGGIYHLMNIPDGFRIVGFYGMHGVTVYRLGFVIAKTIYPAPPKGTGVQIRKLELQ